MAKKRDHQSKTDSLSDEGSILLAERPSEREDGVSLDERIRMRAYELYLDRGAGLDDGLGDWLRAEREVRGVSPEESTAS